MSLIIDNDASYRAHADALAAQVERLQGRLDRIAAIPKPADCHPQCQYRAMKAAFMQARAIARGEA